ncbi:hypothetical protein AB0E63_22750 [Kribbella sp. NPDC026596]|uniref:hypothetical protein n=1 Tax=Kribbella sp. NPDC026596 TaxID=3155122 RepID=UPI0033E66BC6
MSRRRMVTLEQSWADRLGVESPADIHGELDARLAGLVTAVRGDVPPAGSAEHALRYGDLLELAAFLTDARTVLLGKEVQR